MSLVQRHVHALQRENCICITTGCCISVVMQVDHTLDVSGFGRCVQGTYEGLWDLGT